MAEIEPHAHGVAALHSPNTGVVDFGEVARAWMAGDTGDAEAVAEMARRFGRLCAVWDKARAAAA